MIHLSRYACPTCRQQLVATMELLACAHCGRQYPVIDGIADFSGGIYYDQFDENTVLTGEQRAGLDAEVEGSLDRIDSFYAPALRELFGDREGTRVLDSGCGNGVSIEALGRHGFDAWGHDLSLLRRYQWRFLSSRGMLSVADGRRLPFHDGFFDAVISSGVIEHIGVEESREGQQYSVRPKGTRDDERVAYLRELLRVTRRNGVLFLDFPNGAFPIDFWHGAVPGKARLHRLSEGFLPTFGEVRQLVKQADPRARVEPVSPWKRLRYRQVGQHWYGRLLAAPMAAMVRASAHPAGSFLRAAPVMPYLVLKVRTNAAALEG